MKKLLRNIFSLLPVSIRIHLKKEVSLLFNDAGYGDTLMVGAVARELKKKFGAVRITVNRTKSELLYNNPNIDATGDRYNGIDLNYHYGIHSAGAHFDKNIIDVMCRKAGIRHPSHSVDIFLSDEEKDFALRIISPLKRPVISLHTTPERFDNGRKLWPAEYWDMLADLLVALPCTLVQLGGQGERPVAGAIHLTGTQDIRRSIAVIGECDLHIGVVSSLMHGAAAMGTRALILYGGFERFRVHGYANVVPLESAIPCAPCIQAHTTIAKCDSMQCMRDILPESVYNKVKELLPITTTG
jgi:ADP-heptose:LPS heptosyltransferase